MIPEVTLTTSHVRFFREGKAFTVPGAGTASASSLPGETDTGWIHLGALKGVKEGNKPGINVEIYGSTYGGASPGVKELKNIKRGKWKRTLKLGLEEMGNTVLELIARTAAQPASGTLTAYKPNEVGTIRGWVHWSIYNADTNTLEREEKLWCEVLVEEDVDWDGDEGVKSSLTCTQLLSTLNAGGSSLA
jgi:hypothetical protein